MEDLNKLIRVELPLTVVSLKADSFLTKVLECNLYDTEGNIIIDGKLIRKKNTSKGKYLEGPKEISIPEGVISIEDYIQWEEVNRDDVKKLTLPTSLKQIGKKAFIGFSVTSIKLPKNLEIIRYGAFIGCSFKTLTIPDNVKIIDDFAFSNCLDLKKVKIGKNVEYIGKGVFTGDNKIESIEGKYSSADKNILVVDNTLLHVVAKNIPSEFEIPSGITKIVAYACSFLNLEKITIPETVETIEENSFDMCKIKKFEGKFIENGMVIVDDVLIKAEYNTSENKDLVIPEKVTKIGDGALQLTSFDVHLPSQLKIIGKSAFVGNWDNQNNCKEILLPNSLEVIGSSAFCYWKREQFKDGRFVIPKNVKYIGHSALTCKGGDIWFEPVIPPKFEDKGIFYATNVFVPAESIEAYKEALPERAENIHEWEL